MQSQQQKAKNRADRLTASTSKTILPSITSQTEAQEEANQQNVINQLVIGAKEGMVKAITKLVGSNVTDAILRMANGSDHKSIDNFTLFEVMNLAINRADQPSSNDVLEQLLKIINHNFDFHKKVRSTWSCCNQTRHKWPRMVSSLVSHSSRSRC
jgi:hypothetical protein